MHFRARTASGCRRRGRSAAIPACYNTAMTTGTVEDLVGSPSVRGMIEAAARRAGIFDGISYLTGDDVIAELTLEAVEACAAWDPRRGSKLTTLLWPRLWGRAVDLRRRLGRRSRSGRVRPVQVDLDYASNVAATEAPAADRRLDVRDMIARLPAQERAAMLLAHYGDEAPDEIARVLGVAKSYAAILHQRALHRLKVGLGD